MVYGKIPANKVRAQSPGGTTTPGEHDTVVDSVEAALTDRYAQLWQEYTDYEKKFFSNGAYSLILELKLAGLPQAKAAGDWVLFHWGRYYARKAALSAMTNPTAIRAAASDVEGSGSPPYGVSDLMAIVAQMSAPPPPEDPPVVPPPAPTITAVTVTNAFHGAAQARIDGTNLADATAVTINGIAALTLELHADYILATYNYTNMLADVSVTTPGGTVTSSGTFLISAPALDAIDPTVAPLEGCTVSITSSSGDSLWGASVTVDGVAVEPSYVSDGEIILIVPAHAAGTVPILVTTLGGTSSINLTYQGT